MKVLIFSCMYPSEITPEAGSFVLEQVKALRKLGIDARVVSGVPHLFINIFNVLNKLSSVKWMEFDTVPVIYFPYPVIPFFRWTSGWLYRYAFLKISDRIRKTFPFDLIHAHSSWLDGMAGSELAKRLKCSLIITEHSSFSKIMDSILAKYIILKNINTASSLVILAVSTPQKNSIQNYLGSDKNNIRVIHNGVDTNIFYPSGDWFPDPCSPHLFFVGYFTSVKNLELLLHAFKKVLQLIPRARLTLIGARVNNANIIYEKKIRDLVTKLNIDQNVDIRPAIPIKNRDTLAQVYREECDILVLTSKAETFGCVIIEALACGKPVVSTRCGGPENIITKPFLGELCENNSVESLAKAICKVAKNITKYDMNTISRHTSDNYSFQVIAEKIIHLYNHLGKKLDQ